MAFNLSALETYVRENSETYLSSLISGAKTIEIIKREGTVMTGVKTSEKINILDTDAEWQEGDGCGFSASGNDTITQRTVTVGNIKINKTWCMADLIPYINQENMRRGSIGNLEQLPAPLEARVFDRLMAKQNRWMEIAAWKADTASADDKLEHFDGFIKILTGSGGATWTNLTTATGTATVSAAGTAVTGSGTSFTTEAPVGSRIYTSAGVYVGTVSAVGSNTGLTLAAGAVVALAGAAFKVLSVANAATSTTANIATRMDLIYAGIPTEVLGAENTRLFIGEDEARTYQRYMMSANLFHYEASADYIRDGFMLPGTALRVTPTPGLNGTGLKFAINPENMVYATDLENEYETFETGYERKEEEVWLKARWRAGFQIAFPTEVTGSY